MEKQGFSILLFSANIYLFCPIQNICFSSIQFPTIPFLFNAKITWLYLFNYKCFFFHVSIFSSSSHFWLPKFKTSWVKGRQPEWAVKILKPKRWHWMSDPYGQTWAHDMIQFFIFLWKKIFQRRLKIIHFHEGLVNQWAEPFNEQACFLEINYGILPLCTRLNSADFWCNFWFFFFCFFFNRLIQTCLVQFYI